MLDILHDDSAVRERAEELGIRPLILGEDVLLVNNAKERKRAAATIVLATSVSRDLIEGPVDGVVRIEGSGRKDHIHYRRGGLTQVEAKILAEARKAYVVDYSFVRHVDNPERLIGRIVANTEICKKYGVPVILASFAKRPEDLAAPSDLAAFWRAMGVDDAITRTSQDAFAAWLARAEHRASDAYIGEGVSKTP